MNSYDVDDRMRELCTTVKMCFLKKNMEKHRGKTMRTDDCVLFFYFQQQKSKYTLSIN